METGLLNFHDEETFATSIYDQGDFSGVDGQSSLYDMMHSDLQYSSDYTNQSVVHWDSDQEQEHNGDLAVLPVAPSECSSLNSSKEDYSKSLFEWQDGLFTYQPLDPDVVCMDGQVIPSELPDNIFEDSIESNTSTSSSLHKPGLSAPLAIPARCSTPIPSPKNTTVSSDASLNLDMSLSALDVNVSDIDVSALGINVSSLDIKADNVDNEVKSVKANGAGSQVDDKTKSLDEILKTEEILPSPVKSGLDTVEDPEFAAIFGAAQEAASKENSIPSLNGSQLPLPCPDVEQLHDIAMEFIKEEQEAQAWNNLPLDCNVDLDAIDAAVPVLEAGNLESLLEQFEATLKPPPEFSQSMPASPAHFSVPPSPLSMPASPLSNHSANAPISKTSPLPSPLSSPAKGKREASTPKKSSPSTKGVSLLHQNILESLPTEIMDRIKASGCKKTIPLIPAMPSKRPSRSGTRMHAAGAALSRNKLLKLVSRKSTGGENIQLDHDYCSNDSSNNIEFVPDKLVMDIQASTKQMEWDEDKSRKDSGLESGDVSEDSEGAAVPSNYSSGYDSSSGSRSKNSLLKPRTINQGGRNKEMLMVSVLKKVRCDTPKSPSSQQNVVQQPKQTPKTKNSAPLCATKSPLQVDASLKPLVKQSKPVQSLVETVKLPPKAIEVKTQSKEVAVDHSRKDAVKSTMTPVEVPQPVAKPLKTIVKTEPPEALTPTETLVSVESKPVDVTVLTKPLEQPKKRKLNFEEYRNRQRAMEQKKESTVSPKAEPLLEKKSGSEEMEAANFKDVKPVHLTVTVKEEKNLDPVPLTSNPSVTIKQEKEEMAVCDTAVPVVDNQKSNLEPASHPKLLTVKQEKDLESAPEVIVVEEDSNDSNSKPVEDKKKQRQYRTRHLSTSSSDGSPQSKPVIKSRRENPPKKAVCSPLRSRSRTVSSSSSRSASSNSSRSSSSSSDSSSASSSSSAGSTHSSGRRKRTTRRRRRSCSRSSRSSSRSTRRSNSISSGSSRRSSPRSARSRRRSRSRSQRRSRRDRSVSSRRSASRGRSSRGSRSGGWKRWRRDSSRNRGSSSSLRRSRSPMRRNVDWSHVEKEHKRQVEERRVIYVGRIPEDTTKAELRRRFEVFGPIVDINLHFREHADNYGFVTFAYKVDAYEAVERGNDDPTQPHYDLCFGGRRKFCRERYADLDGMACNKGSLGNVPHMNRGNESNSFDDMLREVQAKLNARKKL
ncbi:serine/arginine repetitive matrix protein 2-like isoform X2 [Thrips palmi]|uniref:Serine/arginine repetitive matrix protein 2-like isoform X2 n=1 Tax=Thrips palmi TaxID=161013 RepID=A0A6P9AG76_THRPL|nr:serine/arginine repetitive matrix protein 2-like isoform X2 [Thrips palmi]